MRNIQSFRVSTTLAAQRIVTHLTGTAEAVKVPASTAEKPIGITLDTVKDTTSAIPVAMGGELAYILFDDTVATGANVGSDASGRGVPVTATTVGVWSIGTLVGPAVAATGTIAQVLIDPAFLSTG